MALRRRADSLTPPPDEVRAVASIMRICRPFLPASAQKEGKDRIGVSSFDSIENRARASEDVKEIKDPDPNS